MNALVEQLHSFSPGGIWEIISFYRWISQCSKGLSDFSEVHSHLMAEPVWEAYLL